MFEALAAGALAYDRVIDLDFSGWKGWLFADRNDCVPVAPTLGAVADRGLLAECETPHLDPGSTPASYATWWRLWASTT